MKLFPYKYDPVTDDEQNLLILAWCFTEQNEKALLIITGYYNSCYIELPQRKWQDPEIEIILEQLDKHNEWETELVYKRKIYYWTEKKTPFLYVKSYKPLYLKDTLRAELYGKTLELEVHEKKIPVIRKFLTERNIEQSSWIEISDIVPVFEKISTLKHEFTCDYTEINGTECSVRVVPTVAAFDGEMYSHIRQKMPDSTLHKNPLYLMSWVVGTLGKPETRRAWVLVYNCPFDIESILDTDLKVKIVHCDSELDLIRKWFKLIRYTDPDIITGYNIHGWDNRYIDHRLKLNAEEWENLGRLDNYCDLLTTELNTIAWESSAYGQITQECLSVPGRVSLDLLFIVKRQVNLSKYDLKTVSRHYIKNIDLAKIDLSAQEQFRIYESGTREEWETLLKYSARDSVVLLDLFETLNVWYSSVELSKIAGVSIMQLFTHGQQIRTYCRVADEAARQGYVVTKHTGETRDYEGALVQDPVIGKHNFVICLDFNSLYPSIVIANNISPETLVKSDIDPDTYRVIDTGKTRHRWIKETVQKGIFPQILTRFLDGRKDVKAQMKKTSDPFEKMILDQRQLCLKVSANSVYGSLGVRTGGKLPLLEGAESVTAEGRRMISVVADYCRDKYNAQIVYGDTDSVMVCAPGINDIESAQKFGEQLADEVTAIFNNPAIKIAFENVYWKFLLYGKKTYSAVKVLDGRPLIEKPVHKGIILARRDRCLWVNRTYEEMVNKIIAEDPKIEVLIEIVDRHIKELLTRQVPLADLETVSSLGTHYKLDNYRTKIFADLEMQRGRKRNPGERLSFYIMKENHDLTDERNQGYRMRSPEDPDILDLHPDTYYYVGNLSGPIKQVLSMCYPDFVKRPKKRNQVMMLPQIDYISLWLTYLKARHKVLSEIETFTGFKPKKKRRQVRKR